MEIRGDIQVGRPMTVNEDGVWIDKSIAALHGLDKNENPGFSVEGSAVIYTLDSYLKSWCWPTKTLGFDEASNKPAITVILHPRQKREKGQSMRSKKLITFTFVVEERPENEPSGRSAISVPPGQWTGLGATPELAVADALAKLHRLWVAYACAGDSSLGKRVQIKRMLLDMLKDLP